VLGSLPRRAMAAGDIELRVWGGYGLGGTRGVVVRRTGGRWSAWEAHVVQCMIGVPIPVGDTASAVTESLYVARARRDCNAWLAHTLGAESMYDADTLAVRALPSANLGAVWAKALAAGVRELPPGVRRKWIMNDGFTYVVELREGNAYRASVIEYASPPEVDADRHVQAVYDAVVEALAPIRRVRRCRLPPPCLTRHHETA
jgi:hypothetical protein